MIDRYLRLRQYCQENEWAAALSALLLIGLLGTVIYLVIDNHSTVQHWLSNSVLLNGLILLSIIIVVGAFSLSLFCLSSSDCSIEDRTEKVVHRHRPVMVDGLKVVKNLGVNPKRRRKPVRNESS